jgi:hypothetical protein
MNLSRQAKKFRALQPKDSESPKPVADKRKKKKAQAEAPAASAPAVAVEPIASEPVVVPEAVAVQEPVQPAPPKKPWVEKTKRPRFVREKAEKRERVTLPPLISSNKFNAKLLTRNVAPIPKDDADKTFR